jgi:Holliday junction resolvase
MTEQSIQTKIKNKLTASGWLVRKVIQCGDAGWPDLEAFKDGRCLHVEVKRPGQKPTALQEYKMKQLRDNGIEAIVATSVDDVKKFL